MRRSGGKGQLMAGRCGYDAHGEYASLSASNRMKKYAWAVAGLWTLVSALSLGWGLYQHRQDMLEIARTTGRAHFDKEVLYRTWNATHGGVYAPISPETPPNPYLANVPERDIVTPGGRRLTLVNPAYMTRQIFSLSKQKHIVQGHITSRSPINPDNAPDSWEAQGLRELAAGKSEISQLEGSGAEAVMRVMRPLITKTECLACHAQQGYREGDIRGGISISVRMEPLWAAGRRQQQILGGGYGLMWVLGLVGIRAGARRLTRYMKARESMESALVRANEEWRRTFDHNPDLIAIIDTEHRIERINRTLADKLGIDPAEAVGQRCHDLMHDLDGPPAICPTALMLANGKEHSVEIHEERWGGDFLVTASPLHDAHGQLMGSVHVARDITARKRVEREVREARDYLENILANSPDAIGIVNKWGKFIKWNHMAEAVFGYSGEEIQQYSYQQLYADQQELQCMLKKLRTQGFLRNYEIKMKKRDGTVIPGEISISLLKDQQNKTVASVCVGRDITDRKRQEEEHLTMSKLEALGVMAGGIAHDFNNALTAILGNVGLAALISPSAEGRERLTAAEQGCMQAKALANQLLTFAKGGAPIKKVCSPVDIVQETARLALSGSKSRCEFQVPGDLWMVEVDRSQMGQVISNLLINADQAMPLGGIITIGMENVKLTDQTAPLPEGKYVRLTIADQGVGIPPEYLGKIFDPYFTTKYQGSGLGLTTVYSIIKQHGGYIAVDSHLGEGTTFQIYLPAAEAPPELYTDEVPLLRENGRILVMDDEPAVREVAQRLLATMGYEVEGAADGEETIRRYLTAREAGRPFDAVILDLTIPGGLGGQETLERLRALDPDINAIVSSGYADAPIMADFHKYGFRGVAVKPYKIKDLTKVLHDALAPQG